MPFFGNAPPSGCRGASCEVLLTTTIGQPATGVDIAVFGPFH